GPRRRHAQVREERMAPRGTRTDPWLERLRNDERRELSGNVGSGRRARTLLDPAVAREIRHREALRGALWPEVETGLPFDRHRNARQRWVWARLHDRPRVRPDRHGDAGGRGEQGGPAAGREQNALARDDALRRPHSGHAVAVAHDLERGDTLADLHTAQLRRPGEPRERLDGIAVAVLGAEAPAGEVAGADARHEPLDL